MSERSAPRRKAGRAWIIWALAASGFSLAFFMRVSPSVMGDDLMREFAVGAAVLGNLSAIYFYIYAGAQMPIGALTDRWGPRAMIAGSTMVAAAGAALFAVAPDLGTAYVGRFLIGAGSACAFVGTLTLSGRWFAPNRFALMSGLTMLAGMAGGLLGQAPFAVLVGAVGWRDAMLAPACFAALVSVLVWALVRDRPPGAAPAESGDRGVGVLASMRITVSSFKLWCVLLTAASFTGPLLAFGALWGVPYMMTKYGLERPDAAFYVSLNLFGWAFGAQFSGWLSDRIGRRKSPLIVAAILNLSCLSALFYLPGVSLGVSAALIFAIGGLSSTMVISYALAREITPPSAHGSVTGFINMGTTGAGAVLQPICGLLLDLQWDGRVEAGVRVYALAAYEWAFGFLVAWAAAGLVLALVLPETRCRQQVE